MLGPMADTWRMNSGSNSRAASIILRSASFSFAGRLETSTLTSTGTNRLAIASSCAAGNTNSVAHTVLLINRHTEKKNARICRPPRARHDKRQMNFGN